MRVRMKIKHLVYSFFAFGLLSYLLITVVMPRIELYSARQQFEKGVIESKSAILDAIHHPRSDEHKWELVRQYIIGLGDGDVLMEFDVYIGSSFSRVTGAEPRIRFTGQEKAGILHDYISHAPADEYLVRAARQLTQYYVVEGQLDTAIDVIDQAVQRSKEALAQWIKNDLKLEQAQLLAEFGENVESNKVPNNSISQVSGTVKRSDGTPIPYAGVFLRHESDVNHSIISTERHRIMTDARGNYQFNDVLPGSYQLFLGLNFDQISGWTWPVMNDEWIDIGDNEQMQQDIILHPLMELRSPVNDLVIEAPSFEFNWSPVEGAAYYNVNIGFQIQNGSVSSLLEGHIIDNHYLVTVKQLYDKSSGISSNVVDGKYVPDPISLLSFANTDNRLIWSVEAYDNHDKMISRSNGYRLSDDGIGNLPFFYLRERTMTEADHLLLSGELDLALAAYKEEYEQYPDDIHSLRMIIRLLKPEDEKLPYLQSIAALYPSVDNVFALAYDYYEKRNWSSFIETYMLYDLEEQMTSFEHSTYATVLMKLGRLQEARQLFQQAMEFDSSHRFVGNYIAIALYEDEGLDSALDIAHRHPERKWGSKGNEWTRLLVQLQKEMHTSDNPDIYMEQLKQKLEWTFQDNTEQLEQWMATSDQTGAKAIIRAILAVE